MDQELDLLPRCNHVKTTGERYGSPALRNQSFCYYHKPSALRIQNRF